MTEMLIDELKMAVDSSFSFLNLRRQHTNLKLKLLFKIETQTNSLSKIAPLTLLTIDQIQIVKDLTTTDQIPVATTHYRGRSGSDRPLYSYTSQPQIHKLGLIRYETNI